MRESENQRRQSTTGRDTGGPIDPNGTPGRVPYKPKAYFESCYRATVQGDPTDSMTIGVITEMESRFHYNSVENSIIRVMARLRPPPSSSMVRATEVLERRRGLRLLDVGSGTGHWIDFMVQCLYVSEAVGTEITDQMLEFLHRKYADRSDVAVMRADIAEPSFSADLIGGTVDYVTAIGVMFHLVDDERWKRAVANIAGVLEIGGLAFIGGEFGPRTEDVELAKADHFDDWKEYGRIRPGDGPRVVTKRVRSLADWHRVTMACGLRSVDLVRSDREPQITTPENDILVLRRFE